MIYLFMNNGGLGNQMFQYALARKLQEKYNKKIVCELKRFSYKRTDATKREFALSQFKLTNNMELKEYCNVPHMIYILKHRFWAKRLSKKTKEQKFRIMVKRGIYAPDGYFDYFDEPDVETKYIYINGLFQAHGYFDDIRAILQKEFQLKQEAPINVKELMEQISQENSVCVHWRRGDYLNPKYASSLLVCNEQYYYEAMDKIADVTKKPVFYIFTNSKEDAEYIKNNNEFKYPVKYVNLLLKENVDDLEDFRLMCCCKNYIISNSTFSWWAQYLSDAEEKIVCAPKIWHKKMCADMLYQDDWILINV